MYIPIATKIYNRIKWAFQTTFRGYSDCDMDEAGKNIAENVYKRLKTFRDMEHAGIQTNIGEAEWNAILNKIVNAWYFLWKTDDIEINEYFRLSDSSDERKEKREAFNKRYMQAKEDAKLMIDWIDNLWD